MINWISTENPKRNVIVLCRGQYDDDDTDDGEYVFLGYRNARGIWYAVNNGDYNFGGFGEDYRARVSGWLPVPEVG